jgi:hypothetical protein
MRKAGGGVSTNVIKESNGVVSDPWLIANTVCTLMCVHFATKLPQIRVEYLFAERIYIAQVSMGVFCNGACDKPFARQSSSPGESGERLEYPSPVIIN